MTPMQVAEIENRAARRSWGERPDSTKHRSKNVAEKVRPYLGSGISRKDVAALIGCTPPAISDALKKICGKL